MRWLPTLIFPSSSPPSSSSSSSRTLKTSASSSSLTDYHQGKKKQDGAARIAWLFGAAKKSTRSRKHHGDCDHDDDTEDDDGAVIVRWSRSPSTADRTYIRSYTSSSSTAKVVPQPLPLPELTTGKWSRHKDDDCPLPSLTPSPTDANPSGFRMRSVFASPRRNSEAEETRTRGVAPQATARSRSSPVSPFESPRVSPQKNKNDDFVPYHYVSLKGNQFWSAPEMATTYSSGLPPPAIFDLHTLGPDNNISSSPCQCSPVISPSHHSRSPTRPSSPIPRLSLDTSRSHREGVAPLNVHPLPLPPLAGTGLLSPTSSNFSQSGAIKAESAVSMKSQWQKGKLIGRGTFGSVYVATNRETGALCAMKEVDIYADDPKSAECIKQLEQEIKILSHLKHPNIVQYYGSEIIEDKFYIYLEYVHPGSINKYVREHCGAITESVVRNFTRHILSGLAYLHSKKTIHRDIKGANLLVDSAGVVKLADFGMSKHLTGQVTDLSLKGSPYWMAPELLHAVMQKDNSTELAFAIDIWSLGCTIIEMFTGKPPWSEYEGAAAMFKVMKDTPAIPEALSSEGKDFLRLCFRRNPAERPTALMLLDHRFMKNSQHSDVLSNSTHLYNC